jgi:Fe-S-cluster containining protein
MSEQKSKAVQPGPVWYRDGLRFECTQCGQCCTGVHGYVWVGQAEIEKMAAAKGLDLDEFGTRYLRRVAMRYALLDDAESGNCIFLDDKSCTIYEARPDQCRRFPWWSKNLGSPGAWQEAAVECEGISDEAPLVKREEIDRLRNA